MDLTVRGHMSAGTYEGKNSFLLTNTAASSDAAGASAETISGGTFASDREMNVQNDSIISGGTFSSREKFNLYNEGKMKGTAITAENLDMTNNGATAENQFTAADVNVVNTGIMEQDELLSTDAMMLTNEGTMDDIYGTASNADGTMEIHNAGGIIQDSHLSAGENLFYNDSNGSNPDRAAQLLHTTLSSMNGNVIMGISKTVEHNGLTGAVKDVTVSAGEDVIVISHNDVGFKEIDTRQNVNIKTDKELQVQYVNAGGKSDLTSGEAMDAGVLKAGTDITLQSGNTMNVSNAEAEKGGAYLTSKDAMHVDILRAGTDALLQSGDSMNVSALTVEKGNAELTSKGDMTVDSLKSGVDTKLQSEGDITLRNSETGHDLSARSGGTLTAGNVISGSLKAEAGQDIKAIDDGSEILTGDIFLKAERDIILAEPAGSEKLEGVDPGMHANDTNASGSADSIFRIDGTGSHHVSSGGDGVRIHTNTGNVSIEGRRVEADKLESSGDMNLSLKASQVGIDEIRSNGTTEVEITGREKEQAYFAGIHSASSPFILKNSKVQHLDLTGRDEMTLSNIDLGGDSVITTDHIRVTMEKNGPDFLAEHLGYMKFSGRNVDTDHLTGIVKDPLTLDGSYLTKTGQSILMRNFVQEQELGEEGRKREKAEKNNDNLIEVAAVMKGEIYQ